MQDIYLHALNTLFLQLFYYKVYHLLYITLVQATKYIGQGVRLSPQPFNHCYEKKVLN